MTTNVELTDLNLPSEFAEGVVNKNGGDRTAVHFKQPWSRSLGYTMLSGAIMLLILAALVLVSPAYWEAPSAVSIVGIFTLLFSFVGFWVSMPYILNHTNIVISKTGFKVYTTPNNCWGSTGCNYNCDIAYCIQFQVLEKGYDRQGRPRMIVLQAMIREPGNYGQAKQVDIHEWAASYDNYLICNNISETLNNELNAYKTMRVNHGGFIAAH